jgi:hypothetical protein
MNKHQRSRRKCWGINAINVVFLFFAILNPLEAAADIRIKSYVFPLYPVPCNQVRMQASFMVEYSIKEGHIATIRIGSHNIKNAYHPNEQDGPIPIEFVKSINDALAQWTFVQSDAQQTQIYTVSIRFLLGNANTEANTARFKVTVQEKEYMPSEITIEADKIGPDFYKD